jgi:hypothetical protein
MTEKYPIEQPSFEVWSFDDQGEPLSKLLEIRKDKDERGKVSKYHILFWGDTRLLSETGIKKEDGYQSFDLYRSAMERLAIKIASHGAYQNFLFADVERDKNGEFLKTVRNLALAEQYAALRAFLPELSRVRRDVIEDLISIPISKAEEQRQEHNFQYMEFSQNRFPTSRIAITGDKKGFNVRLSRFFFEEEEAVNFCKSAKKLFAKTPPNETRYNFMNPDNKSNPQHTSIIKFKGLQEEQMPILLETILNNRIIGQFSGHADKRDMYMIHRFQELRTYLNDLGCDIPSELFKLRRPAPQALKERTTAAESEEPTILPFVARNQRNNPDPNGSPPRAG